MNRLSSRSSLFLLHVCDIHSLTPRRLQTNIRDIPTPALARRERECSLLLYGAIRKSLSPQASIPGKIV